MANVYEKRIIRVLEYIYANPAGNLSLDNLADVAAMSRFHWHRVFHAMTGETCAQAVRRIRMHHASHFLINTDWSVSKIANQVGYNNEKSFGKSFDEIYGVSPSVFRNKRGRLAPLKENKKGDFIMFEVKIENGEKRELIALFHQGPYEHSGKTFEQLLAMATSRKLWPKVANVVGVHYDDPNAVAAEDLRCHAGLQMKEDLPLPDGMELVELKGGKYAILQYKGPYTAIKTAYDYLFGEWLPNSGHDPANEPSFEVYLNNPAETAPEDLLTDIYLPLAA